MEQNLLVNQKTMLLLKRYLIFQKENGYPPSDAIIIEVSPYGEVVFRLDSTKITTTTTVTQTPQPQQQDPDVTVELDTFDEFIDQIIEDLSEDDNQIYSFKKISRVSDYSLPIIKHKTRGLFQCVGEKLSSYHTGSVTTKNSKYYLPVLNKPEGTENSFHQFDISYGHINGLGSSYIQGEIDLLPAKTMYKKYLLECFGKQYSKFPFKNGKNGDYFYVLHFNRDTYKDSLDAGNFELALVPLSSSINQLVNTGSNFYPHPSSSVVYTLIDESGDTKESIVINEEIQEYYYVTSGSLRDGVYGEPNDDAWGIVFPKMGLIILDGVVLDQSCSFNTVTASIDGDNIRKMFASLSGSTMQNSLRTVTSSFFGRAGETSLVETYFCRANFHEFNHSSNYTYTTGSDGELKYTYFKKNPHSYITTIGLYNRKKELLAVGKLRKPVLKHSGREYIFQVKVKLN